MSISTTIKSIEDVMRQDAAFRYEYDADGNRTKRTSKASGALEE